MTILKINEESFKLLVDSINNQPYYCASLKGGSKKTSSEQVFLEFNLMLHSVRSGSSAG
jgi:hypothetical protein